MKLHRNLALGIVEGLQNIFIAKVPLRIELSRLLKLNRKWGSRDRRLLGQILLDCVRWKTTYAHLGDFDEKTTHFNWRLLGVWLLLNDYMLPEWEELGDLKELQKTLPLDKKNTKRTVRHSIPQWLDELGLEAFGEKVWEKELSQQNEEAKLVLRVNTLKTTQERLKKLLEDRFNINSEMNASYPDALILEKHYKLTHLNPFEKGLFEIQDANSQQISYWADPKPGMKVIDACAGAGGKSLHMAALMENRGNIIALDTSTSKLDQLMKRVHRNRINIIETHDANDTSFFTSKKEKADIVLIDAPCSGLGILRRNPAAKWHINPERMKELQSLQFQILQKNAALVKKGGKLIYATCSIFPSENSEQIQAFLKSEAGKRFTLKREETLLAHQTGFDGFFIAELNAE